MFLIVPTCLTVSRVVRLWTLLVLSSTSGAPMTNPTEYWSIAGALQYLTFTRLDITYVMQQVCLHIHDPRAPPQPGKARPSIPPWYSKYVEIDLHFVWDRVAFGDVRVLHVPTSSQYADIFTKGLPTTVFTEFQTRLNVHDALALTGFVCVRVWYTLRVIPYC